MKKSFSKVLMTVDGICYKCNLKVQKLLQLYIEKTELNRVLYTVRIHTFSINVYLAKNEPQTGIRCAPFEVILIKSVDTSYHEL